MKTRRTRKQKKTRISRGGSNTNITYDSIKVEGQLLTKSITSVQPSVKIPAEHFIIMYDPDAPVGVFLHWLTDSHNTYVPYSPPSPPKGTGVHRYIFKLVKGQPLEIPSDRAPVDIAAILGAQPVIWTKQFRAAN